MADAATKDRLLPADPAGGFVGTAPDLDERRVRRRLDGLAGKRLTGKATHGESPVRRLPIFSHRLPILLSSIKGRHRRAGSWRSLSEFTRRPNGFTVAWNEFMNSPSREAFEVQRETVEARMNARVARIEGKIDAQTAAQAERDKRIELLAQSTSKSAEKASNVTTHIWLAAVSERAIFYHLSNNDNDTQVFSFLM